MRRPLTLTAAVVAVVLALALAMCSSQPPPTPPAGPAPSATPDPAPVTLDPHVCVSDGGEDYANPDAFRDLVLAGHYSPAHMAWDRDFMQDHHLDLSIVSDTDDADACGLILGGPWTTIDHMADLAAANPDRHFAHISLTATEDQDLDNLAQLAFDVDDAAHAAGYLAAAHTRTGTVGLVTNDDAGALNYTGAWQAGIDDYADQHASTIDVLTATVPADATTSTPAEDATRDLVDDGADIIMASGSGVLAGVANATVTDVPADERDTWVIWDGGPSWSPGDGWEVPVLASIVTRPDVAIADLLADYSAGDDLGGVKEGWVRLLLSDAVDPDTRDALAEVSRARMPHLR